MIPPLPNDLEFHIHPLAKKISERDLVAIGEPSATPTTDIAPYPA